MQKGFDNPICSRANEQPQVVWSLLPLRAFQEMLVVLLVSTEAVGWFLQATCNVRDLIFILALKHKYKIVFVAFVWLYIWL